MTEEINVHEILATRQIAISLTGEQWRDILGLLIAAKEFGVPVNTASINPIFQQLSQTLREHNEWPEEFK